MSYIERCNLYPECRFYCMAVLRRCNTLQAQRTIEELFGRIKNIKEKAEHSEHMV